MRLVLRFVAREDFPHGTPNFNYLAYSHSIREGLGFDVHWHDEWEILYVRDGRYVFWVDGKQFTVSRGEALLIDRYAIHLSAEFDPGDGSGYNNYVFGLRFLCPDKESFIYQRFFQEFETGNLNMTQHITGAKEYEKEILRLCRKLDEYSNSDDSALSVQIALLTIFDLLITNKSYTARRRPESIQNEYIRSALLYINQAYQTPFELGDLAARLHISTDHFIRIFKSTLCVTPKQYILKLRLQYAKSLMRNEPSLSITDVSSSAGFLDNNYFSRIFKKETGMTPSQYRYICQQSQGMAPLPIPNVTYHVVRNRQATGPFDMGALSQMVNAGTLTTESLVWKQGMEGWVKAENVQELQPLFGSA